MAEQLRKVLQRYHDNNITLSKKKMEVGDDVHFAGLMVGVPGCRPDPHKIVADLLSRNPLWKDVIVTDKCGLVFAFVNSWKTVKDDPMMSEIMVAQGDIVQLCLASPDAQEVM